MIVDLAYVLLALVLKDLKYMQATLYVKSALSKFKLSGTESQTKSVNMSTDGVS